jgi:hypothetical protein
MNKKPQNVFSSCFLFFPTFWQEVENNLNGTLPSELYGLSSLEELVLWGNSLQGTLPSHLGMLTWLTSLQLGKNLLSGSFPESFSNLRKLEWLYMDNSALTGSIPPIPSLEVMSIGFNFLMGTFLESSALFANLRIIVLDGNMITGSIPESIFSSSTLGMISLWENQFSGSLTSKLGKAFRVGFLGFGQQRLDWWHS